MVKKRRKTRKKTRRKKVSKTKKPKKRKGFDKGIMLIAFFTTLFLMIFALSAIQKKDKVIITNLEIVEGEKNYIHFDMKHTFSTEKECSAEIKIYRDQKVTCRKVENLGTVKPNQVISKSLLMPFPGGETDFKVDIGCW